DCYKHLIYSESVDAKPGYVAHEVMICTKCATTFWLASTDLTNRPLSRAVDATEPADAAPAAEPHEDPMTRPLGLQELVAWGNAIEDSDRVRDAAPTERCKHGKTRDQGCEPCGRV